MKAATPAALLSADTAEAVERMLQELEALESIYGYEDDGWTIHSQAELALLRSLLEAGTTVAAQADAKAKTEAEAAAAQQQHMAISLPQLEIELCLKLDVPSGDGSDGAATARLRCALPAGYPAKAAARVSVSVEGLRRARQDELSAALQRRADEMLGDEAVLELAQELETVGGAALADEQAKATAAATSTKHGRTAAPPPAASFGRRWIVSHHLKNPSKRANIVSWARELALGGVSKPGHPGVVVVEGDSAACDEFFRWVKTRTGTVLQPSPPACTAVQIMGSIIIRTD
jgi:hypothetical protein